MSYYEEEEIYHPVPFVIIVDRSGSMKGNGGIELINDSLPDLVATIKDNPEIEESASVGLLSFAGDARVHRQIEPLNKAFEVPTFKANGPTSYAAPLNELRSMIAQDVPQLGARGRRPIAFFITDGKPNHEEEEVWLAARGRLLEKGFHLRPKLVALGCGNVNQARLEQLASAPSLAHWESGPTREALRAILRTVRGTIITLTQEDAGGGEVENSGPGDFAAKIFAFTDYETGTDGVFAYRPA